MRRLIVVGVFLLFVFIVITVRGWYPIALVDGSVILARTWWRAETAAKYYANARALAVAPHTAIDFSAPEHANELLEIRKNTLTFLIEDIIVRKKGSALVSDLEERSQAAVGEVLRGSANAEAAAETIYGLDFDEFQELILSPQARRDVLTEELVKKNQPFANWFEDARKSVRVRVWFVPFRWNGEGVE